MMSLINTSTDWSQPEHFSKSDGHPKSMNKPTLIYPAKKRNYLLKF